MKKGGMFVDYKDKRVWVFDCDVDGVLVNGRPTSYEEQARLKVESGFVTFLGTELKP